VLTVVPAVVVAAALALQLRELGHPCRQPREEVICAARLNSGVSTPPKARCRCRYVTISETVASKSC